MKKKILVISHDFVKKVNIKIYEELSKIKNLDILCLRPKKLIIKNKVFNKDYDLNTSKVKIKENKIMFEKLRYLHFKNIKKIIVDFKPDYIIVHNDPISFQVLILIFFSFFFKYSIFCVSNENEINLGFKNFSLKKFFKSWILIILNRLIKYKISAIFCISKQIKNCYEVLGYKKKTILMPIGFDPDIFKKRKKMRRIFTIAYFGRITKEKGIHILVKALEEVNFKFNFILDTSHIEDAKYYKILNMKLKKNLKIIKLSFLKCNHFEISKYMSRCDLIILPSIYNEQYGRVIQEAVACGSLVLGSNVGAIGEIIGDKDLLFKKNNYKDLYTKINKLKNDNKYYFHKQKKIYKRIIKQRSLNKQLSVMKRALV